MLQLGSNVATIPCTIRKNRCLWKPKETKSLLILQDYTHLSKINCWYQQFELFITTLRIVDSNNWNCCIHKLLISVVYCDSWSWTFYPFRKLLIQCPPHWAPPFVYFTDCSAKFDVSSYSIFEGYAITESFTCFVNYISSVPPHWAPTFFYFTDCNAKFNASW